jgi:WD40 repeat protein/tRNA A-37 threonylcarbamoyl transferase component Bud32
MEASARSNHMTVCPSRDELAAFSAGMMLASLLEAVANHLCVCPRCESTVRALEDPNETILSELRHVPPQDPLLEEPECRQLEVDAKVIRLDGASVTSSMPTRPAANHVKDLPLPAQLGQYELLERLGKGGMGVVYKARQPNLHRLVALKRILSGAHASCEELARFQTEATDLAHLRHPNIVHIYETGEDENCRYFAMEFVDGGSLARQLDGAPLPPRRAAELVQTLARAIHHAHEQGIVHRDLKPANVLLTIDGVPKISDFGLAKCLGSEGGYTEPGAILGTPSYMAPEQAEGRNHEIGPVTDIYGLGAILYELLTGRPPFRGTSAPDTLHQVRCQEPVPPSRLQPKVPRDLETICLKCLQKEPHKRYASALGLAEDIQRCLRGEPILARPVGRAERLWRWCRRNPALAAASGLAAVFLVFAAAVSTIFAISQSRSTELLSDALAASEQNRQELVQAFKRSARITLAQGLNLCEQGDASRGVLWLAHSLEMATQAEDADLQHVIRLNLAAVRPQLCALRACLAHDDDVLAVAFSPDGKMVLTGSKDGNAERWDAASGERVGTPLRHEGPVKAVAFSPDGKIIATGNGELGTTGEARLWDAATGNLIGSSLRHEGPVHAVVFSPDSRTILTTSFNKTSRRGEIRLWDVATGIHRLIRQDRSWALAVAWSADGEKIVTTAENTAQVWSLKRGLSPCAQEESPLLQPVGQPLKHEQPVLAVAFSPDGKTVLTGSRDKTARIWDAATGRLIGQPLYHQADVSAVAFASDGGIILTGCNDNTARIWQTTTGKPMSAPLYHRGRVLAVAFSSDGRTVVTGANDKTARLWDVSSARQAFEPNRHPVRLESPTYEPMYRSLQHKGSVRAVAISPDGRIALTGSREKSARLWDTATGKPVGRPLEHAVFALSFSPDGKMVLTGGWDKTACLWDASTGKKLHSLNGHTGLIHAAAFSPDGRTALTASADHTARLWNVATGQPIARPLRHQAEVTAAAFSPEGKLVLTGGVDKTARLWETATSNLVHELVGHKGTVEFATFSRDGKRILTGSLDHTARIWETVSGLPVGPPLLHHDKVWAGSFSPDGKLIVTASWDGTARLWHAATGEPAGPALQHQGGVVAVAFSPNGQRLLTGSRDGTARIWDVATGEPIGPPLEHQGEVWAVAFSPDGRTVLTGSDDKTARLWQVPAPLPLEGPVERIVRWTQLITGLELDPNGLTNAMSVQNWQRCRQRLLEMSGPRGISDGDFWRRP